MDYSAVAADEHQHGASPWATSSPAPSPDHSRTNFPADAQYDEASQSRPTTADSEQLPSNAHAENGDSRQHQEPRDTGLPAQSQSRTVPSQRIKGQSRERRPQPLYKLSAKVTGLERNGRKDPILRFDVYVMTIPASNFRL